MDAILIFLLIFAFLLFYFIPTLIANVRNCQHSGTIIFINLIFGWTVLGWIAALIWAIAEKPEATKPAAQTT